jgi:predicted metal-dependent enzyme (double-stranded beta helix superfamily)
MNDPFLEKIGDRIAKQEGYPGLEGIKAIYRYLIDKYRWLPDDVRKLDNEDLHLLLAGYEEKATTAWD